MGLELKSELKVDASSYELFLRLRGIAQRGFSSAESHLLSVNRSVEDLPNDWIMKPFIRTLADTEHDAEYYILGQSDIRGCTKIISKDLVIGKMTARSIIQYDLSPAGRYLPLGLLPLIQLASVRDMLISKMNENAQQVLSSADGLEKRLGEIK